MTFFLSIMNLNELKKQSPDKRVKELKNLIRNLKIEIEEKEDLLRNAENLLVDTEEEVKVIEKVVVDEEVLEPVDISKLEKTTVETFQELGLPPEPEQLARTPIADLYGAVKTLYESQTPAAEAGLTYEERERQRLNLYALNHALDEKREQIKKGEYKPTEKASHMLTATEELINKMYKN